MHVLYDMIIQSNTPSSHYTFCLVETTRMALIREPRMRLYDEIQHLRDGECPPWLDYNSNTTISLLYHEFQFPSTPQPKCQQLELTG